MKTTINLTIDVDVWKKIKHKLDNVSAFVEKKFKEELND